MARNERNELGAASPTPGREVNVGVRTCPGVDGRPVIVAAWCETCGCESLPFDHDGTCGWCGTVIVGDEPGQSVRRRPRTVVPPGAYVDPRGWVIRTHSRAGYARGCRCDICRAAHTRYMRARREAAA